MNKLLIFALAFAAFAAVISSAATKPEGKNYFVNNPKSFDYKLLGKKGDHRFGVEVKDNKQFHHTTTAEDGVRLGCYGHELGDKKFSTHYVADGKGYRLVPHDTIITVYPNDGSDPRKASFVQAFTEEEFKNSNIRYLFPEGCESPKIEVEIPPIEKMGTAEELPTEFPTELPTESPCTDFCCEDNRPQIFFPRSNQNSCCKSVSKLVVPIDLTILDNVPTAAIAELSNEIDPVLMLVKLMKLIENTKY